MSELYYKRWLHTDTLIEAPDVAGLVRVTGVNPSTGELCGVSTVTGDGIMLSPGSSSFDILKGMVTRKL